jgi:hypothetical protein
VPDSKLVPLAMIHALFSGGKGPSMLKNDKSAQPLPRHKDFKVGKWSRSSASFLPSSLHPDAPNPWPLEGHPGDFHFFQCCETSVGLSLSLLSGSVFLVPEPNPLMLFVLSQSGELGEGPCIWWEPGTNMEGLLLTHFTDEGELRERSTCLRSHSFVSRALAHSVLSDPRSLALLQEGRWRTSHGDGVGGSRGEGRPFPSPLTPQAARLCQWLSTPQSPKGPGCQASC